MDNGEESALTRDIGYTPTEEDEGWDAEMKRNGVDVKRMKKVDQLIEEQREEGEKE